MDTDTGVEMHPVFEGALTTLTDAMHGREIPDDGTGVLDTDRMIGSIGGFLNGVGEVFDHLAEYLAEGPTNASVVQALQDFNNALRSMATDSAEVYQEWRTNDDNAHDLRRAEGEIANAHLFNVA